MPDTLNAGRKDEPPGLDQVFGTPREQVACEPPGFDSFGEGEC